MKCGVCMDVLLVVRVISSFVCLERVVVVLAAMLTSNLLVMIDSTVPS